MLFVILLLVGLLCGGLYLKLLLCGGLCDGVMMMLLVFVLFLWFWLYLRMVSDIVGVGVNCCGGVSIIFMLLVVSIFSVFVVVGLDSVWVLVFRKSGLVMFWLWW